VNCKNGFGFAHNGVCVIRGENAPGKKEAAASDPRLQVTANRPAYAKATSRQTRIHTKGFVWTEVNKENKVLVRSLVGLVPFCERVSKIRGSL